MNQSRTMWIMAAGAFDFVLEQSVVSPALPKIQISHHASPTAAVWLLTGFLLAAAVATPLAGRLGDRHGHRRVMLWSLYAFVIGSLVCAVGGSIGVLIAGRVVQGLGAGVGPLALVLACEGLDAPAAAKAVGFLVGASSAGAVVGGLIAGLLVDHVSIASIFWLLFGSAVVLAVAVWRLVPESAARVHEPVDWLGGGLLAGGLLALVLAISEGNSWGWASARVIVLEALALALLVAFVIRERATQRPLAQLRTLARRPMWTANLGMLVVGFAFFVVYALVPLIGGYPKGTGYGLGLSATQIALVLLPAAIASLVGGLLAGRLVKLVGARNVALFGAACATATYIAYVALRATVPMIALATIPLGLGVGLSLSAILDVVIAASAASEKGVTVALNNVIRTIAGVLGPQVAIAIVTAAPALAPGLPAHSGFQHAFAMAAVACGVSIATLLLLPGRQTDPVLTAEAVGPAGA